MRRWVLPVVALIAVAVVGFAVVTTRDREPPSGPPARPSRPLTAPPLSHPSPTPPRAVAIRFGTFNILGFGHTGRHGNKPGYQGGRRRMGWALRLLDRHRLGVVGLQEMEDKQWLAFHRRSKGRFGAYPGLRPRRHAAVKNTIVWRRKTWRLVSARVLEVPYFFGRDRPQPYVLLEHRRTGGRVWFYNSHNPADVRGQAARLRRVGFRREARLVNRLRHRHPEVPVVSLGDKNAHADYFCPLARRTGMISADGARVRHGRCVLKRRPIIDWILTTPDLVVTGYAAVTDDLVRRASDHPLVYAVGWLSPPGGWPHG